MKNLEAKLKSNIFDKPDIEPTRDGFGNGSVEAWRADERVVESIDFLQRGLIYKLFLACRICHLVTLRGFLYTIYSLRLFWGVFGVQKLPL